MNISKEQIKTIISEAILQLKEAGENDNGYRIKIYLDSKGELGYQVIQANFHQPDFDYLYSFPYKFPFYNNDSGGSIPYMKESGIEDPTMEQIKEWDWAMFCDADIYTETERLVEDCIESIEMAQLHEVA